VSQYGRLPRFRAAEADRIVEIAARVLRAGERIHEVPISYKARGREAAKKLTAFDGVPVLARSSAAA